MGQSWPLFVYFRSFHIPIQMTNINWKKHRWCAWGSKPRQQDGRRRRIHWAMAAPLGFINLWDPLNLHLSYLHNRKLEINHYSSVYFFFKMSLHRNFSISVAQCNHPVQNLHLFAWVFTNGRPFFLFFQLETASFVVLLSHKRTSFSDDEMQHLHVSHFWRHQMPFWRHQMRFLTTPNCVFWRRQNCVWLRDFRRAKNRKFVN